MLFQYILRAPNSRLSIEMWRRLIMLKNLTLAPSQLSRFPDITTSLSAINYFDNKS